MITLWLRRFKRKKNTRKHARIRWLGGYLDEVNNPKRRPPLNRERL